MNRGITKYDALFLIEILIGFILNRYIAQLSVTAFLLLALVGLLFEVFTRTFWTYSDEFRRSIFTIDGTDVSISAAFSWAGVLTICINVITLLQRSIHVPYAVLLLSIIVVGIIGNIVETVCCHWGMFVYTESWMTRMVVLKKSLYLWDVPVMVRLGYFTSFGPLCAVIVHWSKVI